MVSEQKLKRRWQDTHKICTSVVGPHVQNKVALSLNIPQHGKLGLRNITQKPARVPGASLQWKHWRACRSPRACCRNPHRCWGGGVTEGRADISYETLIDLRASDFHKEEHKEGTIELPWMFKQNKKKRRLPFHRRVEATGEPWGAMFDVVGHSDTLWLEMREVVRARWVKDVRNCLNTIFKW